MSDQLDTKPSNGVLEDKAELVHDMDRRFILRDCERLDLREAQDREAMAETGSRGLSRESPSPPVLPQRVDQLDAVRRVGRHETCVANQLGRSLLENRPHPEAARLPTLNVR